MYLYSEKDVFMQVPPWRSFRRLSVVSDGAELEVGGLVGWDMCSDCTMGDLRHRLTLLDNNAAFDERGG